MKQRKPHSLAGRVARMVCLIYCASILVILLGNFVVTRVMIRNDQRTF